MGEKIRMAEVYAKTISFKIISKLFSVFQWIVWIFNGVRAQLVCNKTCYANSAQKMHVHFKYYADMGPPVELSNFILSHEEFVEPEYVLKDEVTLCSVTKTAAIFVESDKSLPHPTSAEYGFLCIGQMATAVKVISVPLRSFVELSQRLPACQNLVFIHHHTRCGSTLLLNIFAHSGLAVTFSEPRCLQTACALYKRAWNEEESRRLLHSDIKMLTKPYNGLGRTPSAYVIKPSVTEIPFAKIFCELFPDSKNLFSYRDPTLSALSLRRVGSVLASHVFGYLFLKLRIQSLILAIIRPLLGTDDVFAGLDVKHGCEVEVPYHVTKVAFRNYYQLRKDGIDIIGVRYDDLVKSSDTMIPQLLELAGIPTSFSRKAAAAMDKDSQSMSPISRAKVGNLRSEYDARFQPSAQLLDYLQATYEAAGVPGPIDFQDPDFRLAGSMLP